MAKSNPGLAEAFENSGEARAIELSFLLAVALREAPYRKMRADALMAALAKPLFENRCHLSAFVPKNNSAQRTLSAALCSPVDKSVLIWANVSEQVDAKIKASISENIFPVTLKAPEYASGHIIWVLDYLGPPSRLTESLHALNQSLRTRKISADELVSMHPIVRKRYGINKMPGVRSQFVPFGEEGSSLQNAREKTVKILREAPKRT